MFSLRQDRRICTTFLGEAYPPCTSPLSSLTPIALRDLRLETQHRGRVLIVKTFCHPIRMTAIQNAVEDEFGDVELLAIYNLPQTVALNEILPHGVIVAVKEPYYKRTADGGTVVRVDHPSDFISLRPNDQIIPTRLAPRILEVNLSALSLKEEGNAAFKRGDWQLAVDSYSGALQVDSFDGGDDLRRTLHRNRAGAHLRLGHYELAISDALAAIIPAENSPEGPKNANIKALYRAGIAAYEMEDFHQAKKHLQEALSIDPTHKETRAVLGRTEKRLAEQRNGDYNFSEMAQSATKDHTRLDHASFLKNTKIAAAGCRGRGLFATKPLKPGDVVFVEKAFHVAHPCESGDISMLLNYTTNRMSFGTRASLLSGVIDKMIWNPTLANKYLDLFDGGKFDNAKEAQVVDGKVAVDTFQVQSIADFNGFGCPRVKSSDEGERMEKGREVDTSSGIWLHASYVNHSCLANAARAFIGDIMIVRAVHEIQAGEEIFMAYISPTEQLSKRKKTLDDYGFSCDCALCQAETNVSKIIMHSRARLRKKINAFLAANRLTESDFRTVPAAKKAQARKLLEEIYETYPPSLFEHLPRLDCLGIGLWIVQAGGGEPQEDLPVFLGILRDFGYFVTINGTDLVIDLRKAVPILGTTHAAIHAADALRAMGNKKAASALEALAKDIFTATFGVAEGFGAEFKSTP